MATLREIKQRIGSVKNISQVTNAMQLVAASRMKKAQENAARGKLYAGKIYDVMQNLSKNNKTITNPFIDESYSNGKKALIIAFSTQRGLAGGLPSSLLKKAVAEEKSLSSEGFTVEFITIGKKLRDQLVARNYTVSADFSEMPEFPTTSDIQPVTKLLIDSYLSKESGKIVLLYADFVNSMIQNAEAQQLLPLTLEELEKQKDEYIDAPKDVIFEPSESELLETLIPTYLETQLFQKRLETVASEYSSRMMAMKGATDNAKDIMGDLQLDFNKKRQAAITQELAEINGGRISK